MKLFPALSTLALLSLAACETFNQPISSSDFDPLRAPGSNREPSTQSGYSDANFKAGQFVQTIMDNSAFYSKKPKDNADADKLLKRGTSVKVVSSSGSYTKVELDSGEVGFIPTVMLEDPKAAHNTAGQITKPGEYQVYPPQPIVDSATFIEPLPQAAPGEQPPANAIPTVIDPDAPATTTPVPTPTTPTENFAAPAQTPSAAPTEKPAESAAPKKEEKPKTDATATPQ
ncbi:MAG: hypothetical protein QM680_03340 [Luteolibacter sp.]